MVGCPPKVTPPLPRFRPVPVKARHDGWTPERQRAFIAALVATLSVTRAAANVGMTPVSAYRLRKRADAGSFCRAWDNALDEACDAVATNLLADALREEVRPVMHRGRKVGERIVSSSDRMLRVLQRLERLGGRHCVPGRKRE